MAPIRRYLRISKYSVLECRIYLEDPSDTRWLLDPREAVLPRVFESIRPQVLPKLREENERARAKKKSKPVKDVVVGDGFEVSVFLRETGTQHTLLTRQKTFSQRGRISSTSNKLTGAGSSSVDPEARILVESDEELEISLEDVPAQVDDDEDEDEDEVQMASQTRRRQRRRRRSHTDSATDSSQEHERPSKRNKSGTGDAPRAETQTQMEAVKDKDTDDKKSLGLSTTYDGFRIWGWILCLLITRKGGKRKRVAGTTGEETGGQVLMEEWIATQAPQDFDAE